MPSLKELLISGADLNQILSEKTPGEVSEIISQNNYESFVWAAQENRFDIACAILDKANPAITIYKNGKSVDGGDFSVGYQQNVHMIISNDYAFFKYAA